MHIDWIAAFLPTITVLVGILLNRNDLNRLDTRITQVEFRIDSKLSTVEARLDSRMTSLEARFHSDMLLVIGKLTELKVRVARLEEKQAR